MNKSCKLSCAAQLRVWYTAEKISFRLRFQCGEHLFLGRSQADFFSERMALCACAETKRNLACICLVLSFIFFFVCERNVRNTGLQEADGDRLQYLYSYGIYSHGPM